MAMILGIDPGKNGALALLDRDDRSVRTWPIPGTTVELHELVASLPKIAVGVIERPYVPAAIGTANAFKIGQGFGMLKGALAWRDIPCHDVRPVDWKKALGVPADKHGARQKASEFFPACSDQWRLAKEDGRAEAALIAWYGIRWAI